VTVATWDTDDDKVNFFKGLTAATGTPLTQLPVPPYTASAQLNGVSLAADGATLALAGSDGSVALFMPGRNWTRVRERSGDFSTFPVSFSEKTSKMYYVWNNMISVIQPDGGMSPFFTADSVLLARGPAVPTMNGQLIVAPFKENGLFSDPAVIAVSADTGSVAWKATTGAGTALVYYEGSSCIVAVNDKTAACLSLQDGSPVWRATFSVPDNCRASKAVVDSAGNLFVQMSADWGKTCSVALVAASYNTGNVLYSVPLPDGYNARDITMNNRGVVVSIFSVADDTKLSCLMGIGKF
jgi:outer membrane protein assembly factor BamB